MCQSHNPRRIDPCMDIMLMTTVSGVMVDGIEMGSSVGFPFGKNGVISVFTQNFEKADMIAVEAQSYGAEKGDNDEVKTWHVVHAIYGNKVVTAKANQLELALATEKNNIRDKMVMCCNKPYILNGD